MKKWFIIGISIVALTGLAGFAWVGHVFAQSPTPPFPNQPYGRMGGYGMMGGYQGQGMMGGGAYGPMHEDMVAALADALNLSTDEIQTRLDNGETPWQIAEDQGLTSEEAQQIILDVHDKALDQAVEDGLMTQEQADWMDQRMESMWSGSANGYGGCHGLNNSQSGNRYGPMMNWGNTTNQ